MLGIFLETQCSTNSTTTSSSNSDNRKYLKQNLWLN